MVEVASLTVGREFFEDQDNVVSATRICLMESKGQMES